MSYKSPVTLYLDSVEEKLGNEVYQIVNHYFVDVDKDELLKALRYDRDQYNKGRLDGYLEAKSKIVLCKDCAYGVQTNNEDIYWCSQYGNTHYDTFYCAEGERKEIVKE